MGMAKRMAEEASSRGWSNSDKYVCAECVHEPDLSRSVSDASESGQHCSFCDAAAAAEMDILLEAFMNGVVHEYQTADDEGVPWDHGYQGAKTYDSWDLVHEQYSDAFPEDVAAEVYECLVKETWAARDGWRLRWDAFLSDNWDLFVKQITTRNRFVYFVNSTSEHNPDEMGAGELLSALSLSLGRLGCVRPIPPGLRLFRARAISEGYSGWKAADLGTNLDANASPSRFSPVGIAMFYAAENATTALAEVGRATSEKRFKLGQFVSTGRADYLDLTALPDVQSEFDPRYGEYWRDVRFLKRFINEVSKPATEESHLAQIQYIPTQVVAEYFLRTPSLGERVKAIRYNSSITGAPCWVVDVRNEDCLDPETPSKNQLLQLRLIEPPATRVLP
jgi:hypothetical protein